MGEKTEQQVCCCWIGNIVNREMTKSKYTHLQIKLSSACARSKCHHSLRRKFSHFISVVNRNVRVAGGLTGHGHIFLFPLPFRTASQWPIYTMPRAITHVNASRSRWKKEKRKRETRRSFFQPRDNSSVIIGFSMDFLWLSHGWVRSFVPGQNQRRWRDGGAERQYDFIMEIQNGEKHFKSFPRAYAIRRETKKKEEKKKRNKKGKREKTKEEIADEARNGISPS